MGKAEEAEKQAEKKDSRQDKAPEGLEDARKEAFTVPADTGKYNYKLTEKQADAAKDTNTLIHENIDKLDSKKYSAEDKALIERISNDVARGRPSDIDKVFQELSETPEGREQLKKIVKGLNEAYDKAGIGSVRFEYPTQVEGPEHVEKRNQLTISIDTGGTHSYVGFRPGEAPAADPRGVSDSMDAKDWDTDNDKTDKGRAASALRIITEASVAKYERNHGEVVPKEERERKARQEEYERERERIVRQGGI